MTCHTNIVGGFDVDTRDWPIAFRINKYVYCICIFVLLSQESSGARKKYIGGAKCDVVIYDVTDQIFECDTDKPTDIATSEWLVYAYFDA